MSKFVSKHNVLDCIILRSELYCIPVYKTTSQYMVLHQITFQSINHNILVSSVLLFTVIIIIVIIINIITVFVITMLCYAVLLL